MRLGALAALLAACASPEFSSGDDNKAGSGAAGASRDGGVDGANGSGGKHAATGGSAGRGAGGVSGAGGASTAGGGGAQGSGGGDPGGADGGSGISSDAGGAVDAGKPCDVTKEPGVEQCVVGDDYAVFVWPDGPAGGDGTRARPVRTIHAGIALAQRQGVSRVLLCATTYRENVELRNITGALSINGGFSCPTSNVAGWTYAPAKQAQIWPTTGSALLVDGVTATIAVSDVVLASDDAPTDGSSIAAIVKGSTNVTFRRTSIQGNSGGGGSDGAAGMAGADSAAPGLSVPAASYDCTMFGERPGGYWKAPSACGSLGGNGGSGYYAGAGNSGYDGTPMTNVAPPNVYNGAYSVPGDPSLRHGQPGSKGVAGTVGVVASASGVFNADGYVPADGEPGTDGFCGQGGGGGGGSPAPSQNCGGPGGGAGGMGGCGGKLAQGGKGGGASLALLVWDSMVTLEDASLQADAGGDGGKGGLGGSGGHGGKGAPGGFGADAMNTGGEGGVGGDGGPGGSGSGGSGGPSYGLVFHGTAPAEIGMTTISGSRGGKAGPGGGGGSTGIAKAADGLDGAIAARFEVKP